MTETLDEILKQGAIDEEVESSTTEEEEENVEEEEKTPKFDKKETSERFQVLTQHNKELKAKVEEMEAWKEEIESKLSSKEEEQEQSQIPEWFSSVMGENEEAWKGFMGMTEKMQEKVLSRIQDQTLEERQAEEAEAKAGEEWVDNQLELVKETHGELSKSDLNKLMSVVEKFVPTDENGNLDFLKGYEIMKLMNPTKSDTRKAIVDTSNSSRTINTDGYQGMVKVY